MDSDDPRHRLCRDKLGGSPRFRAGADAVAAAGEFAAALGRRAVLFVPAWNLLVSHGAWIIYPRCRASHDLDRAGLHVRDADLLFDRRCATQSALLSASQSDRN